MENCERGEGHPCGDSDPVGVACCDFYDLVIRFPALALSGQGGCLWGKWLLVDDILNVGVREDRVGESPFPSLGCPLAEISDGSATGVDHSGSDGRRKVLCTVPSPQGA